MIPKDKFINIAYELVFCGISGGYDKEIAIKDLSRIYDDIYTLHRTDLEFLTDLKNRVEIIWRKERLVRNLPDWW